MAASGCAQIPLAVFPAPEAGSRKQIKFLDTDRKLIRKDGLLVVRRDYIPNRTVCNIVEIKDGVARIPEKWNLASVWLEVLQFAPKLIVLPGDNIRVSPLIPGYYHNWTADNRKESSQRPYYRDFKKGYVVLSKNNHDIRQATYWWKLELPKLRECSTTVDYEVELVTDYTLEISDADAQRVESFVKRELAHLEKQNALKENCLELEDMRVVHSLYR
ncbi:MAG: hypothetical protein MI923_23465 [Phycisphaerales bacterium]|nr:hypothetical protein [Phycisphaerales bacterium]